MSAGRYCTLRIGEVWLGIAVEDLQEVLIDPDVTPVPLAPPGVLGLLSRRGEIVAVHDGRARFGLPAGDDPAGSSHAILELDGETVALAVDDEGEVLELDDAVLQPVPETVDPQLRRRLAGIVTIDDGRLVAVLQRADEACAVGAAEGRPR